LRHWRYGHAGDIDISELADRIMQPAAHAHYPMSWGVIQPRLNPYLAAPTMMKAVVALDSVVQSGGLEQSLVELVKTRASQINGCAYCLHMHTRDARAGGESEARLYLLDAWRESSLYTDRERAALAWTEAVTMVAQTHVPDSAYEDICEYFGDEELVNLTLLVTMINVWNRIAISFRSVHPVEAKATSPK
jgi:AhpD family alkylhydroperoxidase